MWCNGSKMRGMIAIMLVGYFGAVEGLGISFGKANTEAPEPPKPTAPPARPCSRPGECAGISGTSCVRTHYDSITRCLCGDNLPPVNGQCEGSQTKNLYHLCATSDECNDGLICAKANMTSPPPAHLRAVTPNDKICVCDEENGYKEREFSCSDADILKTSLFAIAVVICIRKLVVY